MFRQDFSCPALLGALPTFYPYEAITLFGAPFQVLRVLIDKAMA